MRRFLEFSSQDSIFTRFFPSTVIPTGLTEEGLPIGIQIIGPEYGDLKTIGLAKLLEKEGYNFIPPSNYSD